ncbi:MAG: GntR family transcriptional regulator [Lentisphaerae bacterium]|nr:GntR family transcriptional regulator [Lentisphaerota bacterium]
MKKRLLCKNLYDFFVERIVSGELSPGSCLPSNQETACEFNVSIMTANRAFKQLAEAGYIRREQGRGSFVCDSLPSSDRRIYHIGIADSVTYPVVPVLNAALDIRPKTVSHYLQDYGCTVRMISYDDLRDSEIICQMAKKLDGLVISAGFLDRITESNLSRLDVPIVVINHERLADMPFHQLIMDMRPALMDAAARVVAKNYREVIIVRESHPNGMIRCVNFIKALIKCGFNAKKIRCCTIKAYALMNEQPFYELGMKLCSDLSGKLLFSTSDVASFYMMKAFVESGGKPGKDFDLLSFDNLEEYGYCPFEDAVLTSIDYPKVEISEKAAQLLLEKIEKPSSGTTIYRVPATLKIRSTAFNDNLK